MKFQTTLLLVKIIFLHTDVKLLKMWNQQITKSNKIASMNHLTRLIFFENFNSIQIPCFPKGIYLKDILKLMLLKGFHCK